MNRQRWSKRGGHKRYQSNLFGETDLMKKFDKYFGFFDILNLFSSLKFNLTGIELGQTK
jgi:hypothetical protein